MKKLWNRTHYYYSRSLVWIGHRYLAAMASIFAYSVAGATADHFLHFSTPVEYCILAVMFIAMAAAFYGDTMHDDALCTACYADMPVNPGELAAGKYRPYLRREHWLSKHFLFSTAALLSFWVMVGVVFHYTGFTTGQFVAVGMYAMQVILSRHRVLHMRYEPWCPYCHDDDWDVEHTETPDPNGAAR